jgi:hypothetical protein
MAMCWSASSGWPGGGEAPLSWWKGVLRMDEQIREETLLEVEELEERIAPNALWGD